MKKLNASQEKIMAYLLERAQIGIPPSVREICKATGLKSTSTVHAHLKTLEKNGYISRDAGLNRAIHISGNKSLQVPIINTIENNNSKTKNNIQGYIAYNVDSDSQNELFAFIVKDEGMKNLFILPNDIIVTSKAETVSDSELAVIFYEGKIMLRKLIVTSMGTYLTTENQLYSDIKIEDCTIVGKPISLIRHY